MVNTDQHVKFGNDILGHPVCVKLSVKRKVSMIDKRIFFSDVEFSLLIILSNVKIIVLFYLKRLIMYFKEEEKKLIIE